LDHPPTDPRNPPWLCAGATNDQEDKLRAGEGLITPLRCKFQGFPLGKKSLEIQLAFFALPGNRSLAVVDRMRITTTSNTMTIGETIRQLRQDAGLTALQLGQLVGMQEQAILHLERDATRNPGLTTMLRLVKAMGQGLSVFDDVEYLPDRRGARKVRA